MSGVALREGSGAVGVGELRDRHLLTERPKEENQERRHGLAPLLVVAARIG